MSINNTNVDVSERSVISESQRTKTSLHRLCTEEKEVFYDEIENTILLVGKTFFS